MFISIIEKHRAPGKAAAHTFKQDRIALFDLAFANCDVQGQRYRRGRRVPVLIDRHDQFFQRQLQLSGGALHDPDVGLVRNQPVNVGIEQIRFCQGSARRTLKNVDRQLENRRAVHFQ